MSNRSSRLACPFGPSNTYCFSILTIGSRRRSAARASSARVASFSLTSRFSLAACHSPSDTICGSSIDSSSASPFLGGTHPTTHGSLRELSYDALVQRTRFGDMACSIARTLDVAGEPWSPLILRDVWVGVTRFDDLQRDLAISRKVLSDRLATLVAHGLLERRAYSDRPLRHEYLLTAKGYEFCDILLAITAWG